MSSDDAARGALANVLGALALVVTDEVGRRVAVASGRGSVTDAAAVSALGEFLDGSTVDGVHKVLGLTPSGAVRLVDRLVEAELVSREAGPDNRSRAIRLTEDGRRLSEVVREARLEYLLTLTAFLSVDAVATLRELLGRVMAAVVGAKEGGAWTCRLCDLAACRRSQGECPTYNASVAKDSRRALTAD